MDLSKVQNPASKKCFNRTELDLHADTCVAGANTVPLYFTDETVSVAPFIGEYKSLQDVPIASVATAWDSPIDGSTVVLVINEALYFGDRMPHTLLCPNQLRSHGVQVFDTPKVFNANSPHAIIVPGQIQFPLQLHGIISFLETRKPTKEELRDCDRFELTSAASWNPFAEYFQQKEDLLRQRNASAATRHTPLELLEDVLPRLVQAIHISPPSDKCLEQDSESLHGDSCRNIMAVGQSSRATVITKEDLAR
jgi:hypothetical protein